MKQYKIITFLFIQIFFCANIFGQTKIWNLVFDEHQATLGIEQTESLDNLIQYLTTIKNENLSINLEGGFDHPSNLSTSYELFNQRTEVIKNYLTSKLVVSKQHFDECLFQFSRSADFLTGIDTSIHSNQIVRIFLNYENSIIGKNNVVNSNSTIQNTSKKINSDKPASKNTEKKVESNIVVQCSPITNSVAFKYYCNQSITIIGKNGAEVHIPKNTIRNCYDGMPIKVKLKVASTTKELLSYRNEKRFRSQSFRLGSFIDFAISSRYKVVRLKGCLKIKLPSNEIKQGNFAVMRTKAWRIIKKPKAIEYIDNHYAISHCLDLQSTVTFGIGQHSFKKVNIHLDNKEPYLQTSNQNPFSPVMIYQDGSIVYLTPFARQDRSKKKKSWQYFRFPVFKNLDIKGTLHDSYFISIGDPNSSTLRKIWKSQMHFELYELKMEIDWAVNQKGDIETSKKERLNGRKILVYKVKNVKYKLIKYKPSVITHYYNRFPKEKMIRNLRLKPKNYLPNRF